MQRLKYIGMVVLLVVSTGLQGQDRLLRGAEKALAQQDLGTAILYYEALARRGNHDAQEQLAQIHFKLRDYPQAHAYFQQAEASGSLAPDAWMARASTWLSRGEPDSAIHSYQQVQAPSPRQAEAREFIAFLQQASAPVPDSQFVTVDRLRFNSDFSDFAPMRYGNGFLFCSERLNAVAGVTYYSSTSSTPLLNIYYVEARDSSLEAFGRAGKFEGKISTPYHEGPATFAEGDSLVFFTRSRGAKGKGNQEIGIYWAEKRNGEWETEQRLEIPGFEDRDVGYPNLGPGGQFLIVAGRVQREAGDWDLYRVPLTGTEAGTPVNLGPKINTRGNESMPFLHPDGSLYFASDGHPGWGGMDLFVSYPDGDAYRQPTNLGRPINSNYDDFSCWISPQHNLGLFASNRKAGGRDDDIYRFQLNRPQFEECPEQVTDSYCYRFSEDGLDLLMPEGLYFEWDLGDGTRTTELEPVHCYEKAGDYVVSLMLIDSINDIPISALTTYELQLEKTVQPFVLVPDTHYRGRPLELSAANSHLPDLEPEEWYWDFGDGSFGKGLEALHTYADTGIYAIQLGIQAEDRATGLPEKVCVVKNIRIVEARGEDGDYAAVEPVAPQISMNAPLPGRLSFGVQIGTSMSPIEVQPRNFRGLNSIRRLRRGNHYRYLMDQNMDLEAAYERLQEARQLGYQRAVLLAFRGDSLLPGQPFRDNWLPGADYDFSTVLVFPDVPNRASLSNAKLVWEDLNNGAKVAESPADTTTGFFQLDLEKGAVYSYYLEAKDYFPQSSYLALDEKSDALVFQDTLKLVSVQELIEEGKPVRLNNIFFDYDKATLKPESHQELYRVLRFLHENPGLKIEIAGHTDSRGADAYNRDLSRRRASAVARFLINSGAQVAGIEVEGFGESRPISSNRTARGRKLNRRVEFRILKR